MQLDLTRLELSDRLEDASQQNSRFMQLVLSLDILHLTVRFHIFELFDSQPHSLVTLTIEDVLNALELAIRNQPQFIVCDFFLVVQLFLVFEEEGVVVAEDWFFVNEFPEEEEVGV